VPCSVMDVLLLLLRGGGCDVTALLSPLHAT
jgi:hypothetical protein